MNNIINRINNEFDFNYQKFVKNNNISEITSIKKNDKLNNNFKGNQYDSPAPIETMNFDIDANYKTEKEVEVLKLDD